MSKKLEEIGRRGGASIRVGSVGTISSLMSRELESASSSSSYKRNPKPSPVSVSCGSNAWKLRKSMDETRKVSTKSEHQDRISVLSLATPKRQKQKTSPEEARGGGKDVNSRRSPEFQWKSRSYKRTHHIPMLESEDIGLDKKTKKKEKTAWKVSLVEVVDTNCGIPAGPLSSRLKKLSFAKLSQSII